MKKISDLLKNMHFWVKNRFSEILKIDPESDSVVFLEAVFFFVLFFSFCSIYYVLFNNEIRKSKVDN